MAQGTQSRVGIAGPGSSCRSDDWYIGEHVARPTVLGSAITSRLTIEVVILASHGYASEMEWFKLHGVQRSP